MADRDPGRARSAASSASTGSPTTSSSRSSSPSTTRRRRSTRSSAGSAPSRSGSRSSSSTTARRTAPARSSASWSERDADLTIVYPRGQPGQGRRLAHRASGTPPARSSSSRTPTSSTTRRSIPQLIQPIVEDQADVVFGSRFIGETHRVLYFWHSLANKFLTLLSNMFTNLNLTDMEVCYKVFRREVIQGITLKSDRFGFEPEVTAKVARFKIPAENGRARAPAGSTRSPSPTTAGPTRRQEDRHQGRLPGPLLHRPLRDRRLTAEEPAMREPLRRAIARWSATPALAMAIVHRRPPVARSPWILGRLRQPRRAASRRHSRGRRSAAKRARPRPKPGQGEARQGPRPAAIRPASTWAGRSPT